MLRGGFNLDALALGFQLDSLSGKLGRRGEREWGEVKNPLPAHTDGLASSGLTAAALGDSPSFVDPSWPPTSLGVCCSSVI